MALNRRRFGKTNLMVTELSFGAMNLRKLENTKLAEQVLDYVLDSGINLIDTARGYNGENGEGTLVESEVFVGRAIAKKTDLKEPIVVITKGHVQTPEDFIRELGVSREKLGVKGEHDLKIGNNDIKLVYFFHGIKKDRWETIKSSGALDTAREYKEKGLINYIGFSSHYGDTAEIRDAIDTGIFDVVELPYNLFSPSLGKSGDGNMLKYAFEHNLGIINMKAFGGNITPPLLVMLKDYLTIDYETMLRFCLSNQYITTVDAGAMYISQFEADIKAAGKGPLDKAALEKASEEADKLSKLLKNFCRDCRHCQEKFECPQGIDFPTILVQYAKYQVSKSLGLNTDEFHKDYANLEKKVDDCLECGECEPWCDYKLKIRDLLKQAKSALEV